MAGNPYASWPTKVITPYSEYPYGKARDVTVTGDRTGTPWVADLLNDIFGFQQALLAMAQITPSGDPDMWGASQYVEAIQKVSGYPGEVVLWDGVEASPATIGVRLLPLNGQGVIRSTYPDLDDAVYVGDTDNPTAVAYYHATDAAGTSRSTSGVYLILPDRRGVALRGIDPAAAVDPDGATREIGDVQDDSLEEHRHAVGPDPVWSGNVRALEASLQEGTGAAHYLYEGFATGTPAQTDLFAWEDEITIGANNPDETRMVNSATRYCVRY